MAFAAKKDTEYVRDPVFVANFLHDVSAEMGVTPPLELDEVEWAPLHEIVEEERRARDGLSAEAKKEAARARKEAREALKARYGYAIVNGRRVELGNYMVEPSGIFMGRGQHPLRGRWKEGARQSDVTLNHSEPDQVQGDWAEVVWQPESLWVARWKDRLSGKQKYIWLSDTAPVKQEREQSKFDKARRLEAELDRVRARIAGDLRDERPVRRRIATACYLIDALCLRVGDEKDPDEADTVGATTLRPEHVAVHDDEGTVEFHFLGKDSVEWHRIVPLPDDVRANLRELIAQARPSQGADTTAGRDLPQIFPDVSSRTVNGYLSSIVPGLSAKVFRTHHATAVVEHSLAESRVRAQDPEYQKWRAASLANIEAARLCNHNKKESGDWERAAQRYNERKDKAAARLQAARAAVTEANAAVNEAKAALLALGTADAQAGAAEPSAAQRRAEARARRRLASAKARRHVARERERRAREALGKVQAQREVAGLKRYWNLSTSLKSYIDPRVYYSWGKRVDYDVLEKYYPTTLRRKYLWVRNLDGHAERPEEEHISVRACMPGDMTAVVALFGAVLEEHPELDFPLSAREAAERYLPQLGGQWREAFIALDEQETILAFAALGPAWRENGDDLVDVLAVAHPLASRYAVAALVAEHITRALATYNALTPRRSLQLRPRNPSWVAAMPELADALGLADDDPGGVPAESHLEAERTAEATGGPGD